MPRPLDNMVCCRVHGLYRCWCAEVARFSISHLYSFVCQTQSPRPSFFFYHCATLFEHFQLVLVCFPWPVCIITPRCNDQVPPVRCFLLFLLPLFMVLSTHRDDFAPPARRVSPTTLSFDYVFCTRGQHKLRGLPCERIASDYPQLSEIPIHAIMCDWVLQ